MCIPFLCQNSTLIVNLTFDNIRLLIAERITTLSKFLITDSTKIKQRDRHIWALFCYYDLACTLLLEKLYLDAKFPCVYTVYGNELTLGLT